MKNPKSGYIYCTDSKDYTASGSTMVFDLQGNLLYSFTTGVNPTGLVFFSE